MQITNIPILYPMQDSRIICTVCKNGIMNIDNNRIPDKEFNDEVHKYFMIRLKRIIN